MASRNHGYLLEQMNCIHQKTLTNCDYCRFKSVCLPISLQQGEVVRLSQIVHPKIFHKGETLYTQGASFKNLYAIRTGSIKLVRVTRQGEEKLENFFLGGELAGLDSISSAQYHNSAVALNTTSVCRIQYGELRKLAIKIPMLSHNLITIMGREICKGLNWRELIAHGTAEQRVATLIVSILTRVERQGLDPTRFSLPLSRTEMSVLLGLTKETVSRVLGKFQTNEMVELSGRWINVKQRQMLCNAALPEVALCDVNFEPPEPAKDSSPEVISGRSPTI